MNKEQKTGGGDNYFESVFKELSVHKKLEKLYKMLLDLQGESR